MSLEFAGSPQEADTQHLPRAQEGDSLMES